MPHFALAERRTTTRFESDGMIVSVRRKGRLGQLQGPAHDFNRYGLALVLDQPLAKEATVYVSLHAGETKLDNVIGVVHNCIALTSGYRCGIQFRTSSGLQLDQVSTFESLCLLEAYFSKT